MYMWIFAGADLRGITCVPIPSKSAELRTLNVAVCLASPGVDSVPFVPGKTQVRHKRQCFFKSCYGNVLKHWFSKWGHRVALRGPQKAGGKIRKQAKNESHYDKI